MAVTPRSNINRPLVFGGSCEIVGILQNRDPIFFVFLDSGTSPE